MRRWFSINRAIRRKFARKLRIPGADNQHRLDPPAPQRRTLWVGGLVCSPNVNRRSKPLLCSRRHRASLFGLGLGRDDRGYPAGKVVSGDWDGDRSGALIVILTGSGYFGNVRIVRKIAFPLAVLGPGNFSVLGSDRYFRRLRLARRHRLQRLQHRFQQSWSDGECEGAERIDKRTLGVIRSGERSIRATPGMRLRTSRTSCAAAAISRGVVSPTAEICNDRSNFSLPIDALFRSLTKRAIARKG